MEEPADGRGLGEWFPLEQALWVSTRATSVVTVSVQVTVVVAVHTTHPSMLVWWWLQRRRDSAMSCDVTHTFRPESIRAIRLSAIGRSCLFEVCTTLRREIPRQEKTFHCSGIDRRRRIRAWGGGFEAWHCFFRGIFLDLQRMPLSLWLGRSGGAVWRLGVHAVGTRTASKWAQWQAHAPTM